MVCSPQGFGAPSPDLPLRSAAEGRRHIRVTPAARHFRVFINNGGDGPTGRQDMHVHMEQVIAEEAERLAVLDPGHRRQASAAHPHEGGGRRRQASAGWTGRAERAALELQLLARPPEAASSGPARGPSGLWLEPPSPLLTGPRCNPKAPAGTARRLARLRGWCGL